MGRFVGDVWRMENLWRMGVVWTLVAIASYLRLLYHRLRGSLVVFPRRSMNVVDGRRLACIVTGASSGIGKATAKALAMEGYHVILAGHMSGELDKAVSEIKSECVGVSLHSIELDLSSVPSILAFVDDVKNWISTSYLQTDLQLLINNAGILASSQVCANKCYDRMMMINYLGPVLLTVLLLPLLEMSSRPARVVNVVSFTHRCVHSLQITEELFSKGTVHKSFKGEWYRMAHIYEASKVCLLLFSYELQRRLSNNPDPQITVIVADPGIVKTSILKEFPQSLVNITNLILKIMGLLQSPDVGARAVVDAALGPTEASGRYFFGGHGVTLLSSCLSYDKSLSGSLWRWSSQFCDTTIPHLDRVNRFSSPAVNEIKERLSQTNYLTRELFHAELLPQDIVRPKSD